jgi:hypothetical protein
VERIVKVDHQFEEVPTDSMTLLAVDIRDELNKCVKVRDDEDVSTFLRRRKKVLRLAAKYVLAAESKIFENGPDEIPADETPAHRIPAGHGEDRRSHEP